MRVLLVLNQVHQSYQRNTNASTLTERFIINLDVGIMAMRSFWANLIVRPVPLFIYFVIPNASCTSFGMEIAFGLLSSIEVHALNS